jgi:hypothetical protein
MCAAHGRCDPFLQFETFTPPFITSSTRVDRYIVGASGILRITRLRHGWAKPAPSGTRAGIFTASLTPYPLRRQMAIIEARHWFTFINKIKPSSLMLAHRRRSSMAGAGSMTLLNFFFNPTLRMKA